MRKINIKKYQQGSSVSLYNPTMNLLPQGTPLNESIPMQIASMIKPIDVTPYFQAQNLFLQRDKFEEDKRQFEIEKEFKKQDNDLRRIQITKTFVDDLSKVEVLAQHQNLLEEKKNQYGITPETMNKAYSGMEGMQEAIGKFSSYTNDPEVKKLIYTKKATEELLKQQENPQHLGMMSLEDQQRRLQDIQAMINDPYKDHNIASLEISNYYNPEYKQIAVEASRLANEGKKLSNELAVLTNQVQTEAVKAKKLEVELAIEQHGVLMDQYEIYSQYMNENKTEGMTSGEIAELAEDARIISGITPLPAAIQGLMSPTEWVNSTDEERAAILSQSKSKSSTVTYSSIKQDPRNSNRAYQTQSGQMVAVNPYMNSEELSKMDKGSMITIVRPDGSDVTIDYIAYNKLFGGNVVKDRVIIKDGIPTEESIFGEFGHPNLGVPRSFSIEDQGGNQVLITNDPLVGQQFGLVSAEELMGNPYNKDKNYLPTDGSNPNWKFVPDDTGQTGGHWEFKLGKLNATRLREVASSTISTNRGPNSPVRTEVNSKNPYDLRNNIKFNKPTESHRDISNGAIARIASIPINNINVSSVKHHGNPDQVDISLSTGAGQKLLDFYYSKEGYVNSIITGTYVLHEVDPGTDGLGEGETKSIWGERVKKMGGRASKSGGDKYTGTHIHTDKLAPTLEELQYVRDYFVEEGSMFEYTPELINTGNKGKDIFLNAVALTEEEKNGNPENGFQGGVGYFTQAVNTDGSVDMGKYGINNKWHWEAIQKEYDIDHPDQFIMNPALQRDYMGKLMEKHVKTFRAIKDKYRDQINSESFPLLTQDGAAYLVHNRGPEGAERYIQAVLNGTDPEFVESTNANLTNFRNNRNSVLAKQETSSPSQDNAPTLNF